MRLKFLDKFENMSGKDMMIGLMIFCTCFFGIAKLLQITWNALDIIHIDYWIAFLFLYICLALTGVVLVELSSKN